MVTANKVTILLCRMERVSIHLFHLAQEVQQVLKGWRETGREIRFEAEERYNL